MSQLFAAFGLDWRLLVVNLINFGLLLLGLWYFLYEPLSRMLESRRQRVAEGVHNAERAQKQLEETEVSRKEVLAQAGKEAEQIVAHARSAAGEKERALVAQGEAAAERLLKDAEAQAHELKAQALAESKQELAKLVVLGMEKLALEKK